MCLKWVCSSALLLLQVFGELAVLDSDVLSPVAAISSTAVELYCFDINAMAHVHW